MTVQAVNVASISFGSEKNNTVTSEIENSFDSFLMKDNSDVSPRTEDNSKVQGTWNTKDNKKEAVSLKAKDAVLKEDVVSEEADLLADGESMYADSAKEELPENVLAEILSVLTQIVSVLQNNFQTDNQELLAVTEQLHFDFQDFFNTDSIKELFLSVNDVDVSALLTDENLYSSLEQLQNMISDIFENSEMPALLQQEGFDAEIFEIPMFKNQISAYIMDKTIEVSADEIVSSKEIVIDFDAAQFEKSGIDMMFVSETDSVEQLKILPADTDFEFESNGNSDLFGNERNFEQASMFLHKLVSVANPDVKSVVGSNSMVEFYDIATQIIEQVKIQIRPENTKMELQLNPEHLGKVELEITSKNGELSARLNVQNDHVREAVESQMQVLRETLELQGIKVETIEVTVAEFGFRFQDEQGNAEQFRQRHQRNDFVEGDALSEDESFSDVSKLMQELNGNSVDYVA